MSFRIPKGHAGAGRFTDELTYLLRLTESIYNVEEAEREAQKAIRKLRTVSRPQTVEKYTAILQRNRAVQRRYTGGIVESAVEEGPQMPRSRAPQMREEDYDDLAVVPSTGEQGKPEWAIIPRAYQPSYKYGEEPLDDFGEEWEFGVEYEAGDDSSSVSFNARVSRFDGAQMSKREALGVFDRLATGRDVDESKYEIHGVNWSRQTKSGGTKKTDGEASDVASFEAIMTVTMASKSFRLGKVDNG
ncbi:MAG: hypothetical protein EBU49_00270 [Proteobacteria bacterium]|nr:hypothetical protein [Pseudomonadota bacterium]